MQKGMSNKTGNHTVLSNAKKLKSGEMKPEDFLQTMRILEI